MGNKKDLRQHGYLTSDEFVDMVAPALKSYLKQNWGKHDTGLVSPRRFVF